ncbi:MAG: hypothetical protein KF893_23735 [Caldilineaceae bacterium]|nr:hypothetical protein [Caldilineaceae bacterium]
MSAGPSLPSNQSLNPASPVSIVAEGKPNLWRTNPERMAWIVIFTSFVTFVVMAVSIPLAIQYTIRYATVAQDVQFTPTVGTVLFWPPRANEPIAITAPRNDVVESSRFEAGYSTQGEISLTLNPDSDQAMGTIHLYQGTQLDLVRVRRPRFLSSPEPYRVRLRLNAGTIRLFTNSGQERPLVVEIETPHGEALLSEGIYNFTVKAEETEITVNSGQATLSHVSGETLIVAQGLRSSMSATQPPSEPVASQRNLILNGDFSQPLSTSWETLTVAEKDVVPGRVEIREQDGRRVANFVRRGGDSVHTEVRIRQEIDQDVNVYEALRIELYVKIDYQSLAGAGFVGTEFPVRVEINYTDIYGKDLEWGHGFYYRPPDPGTPIYPSDQILQSAWYFYSSPNLINELKDTRPARITSISVYASGHNYESMVNGISLIVE